ncbi:MAG: glycosyltransferase family 39 protein [Anaerolineae bacterium]|nr:glycosyltransferase family 39 protein [Anaerolineae bacterium]
MSRRAWIGVVVLFVAVLAVHLWSLERFPAPFVDEAWLTSRAWAFIQTQRPFGALDPDVFTQFEGYWVVFPWLPTFAQSLVLRLSPVPVLFLARLVSLFFGLMLLIAVYAIASRLGGLWLGVLSVVLVSMSASFLYSAHLARHDIWAAALGFVAVALFLHNRSSRWWVGLLSGLCVGLAFEVHPYSVIYGPAIVALYFLRWRWKVFRRLDFWSFVAGVSAGLVFYVAIHILPYPETYFALNRLAFGSLHTPPLLTFDLRIIAQSVVGVGRMLAAVYQLLIPLVLWAIVALVRRRSETGKTLLVLNAVQILVGILMFRVSFYYHAILLTPAIDLMVAVLVLDVIRQPWRGSIFDYLRRALVLGCCIGFILLNLSPLRVNQKQAFQATQERVNQSIQPGDAIMAPHVFWFDLHDHAYYPWEELVYYLQYVRGSTLEGGLRAFQPDVLIIDQGWDSFITDDPGDSSLAQHLQLSQTEMEAFISRRARLVDEFDSCCYGTIRVYRVVWE